jgi:hypothetical protein
MLLEEYNAWKERTNQIFMDEDHAFDDFLLDYIRYTTHSELLFKLAHQVYQLQVCMEGMLEDELA